MFKALFGFMFWCASMIPVFAASPPYVVPTTMIDIIKHLGLQGNLKLCLDAGDVNSYDGTSQTWKDVSGNGSDFYRGSTSSAQSADPTFNGTAGRQSSGEYFSFDGGDYFTMSSHPSWLDTLHKSGAKFTIMEWVYLGNVGTSEFGGISGSGGQTPGALQGIAFGSAATKNKMEMSIFNGTSTAYDKTSSASFNSNAWNFIGMSADFSTGDVAFQINDTAETYTGQSLSSPSSSAAADTLYVGSASSPSGGLLEKSGDRFSKYCVWDAGIGSSALASIYSATKSSF